jgi:hypothetical protein
MEGMKIGSIVFECKDFDRMAAFWQQALHYVPREPATTGWVVLKGPEGKGPNISINQTSEERSGKNRLHFDLYTDRQKEEVERLLSIGAARSAVGSQRLSQVSFSVSNGKALANTATS